MLETSVVEKRGNIDGAGFLSRRTSGKYGYNYRLKSRNIFQNLIVDCTYIEEGNNSDRNSDKIISGIRQIALIRILGKTGKTLETFHLYYNNKYREGNGIVLIGSNDRKLQLEAGMKEYSFLEELVKSLGETLDDFTQSFVEYTLKMIEGEEVIATPTIIEQIESQLTTTSKYTLPFDDVVVTD